MSDNDGRSTPQERGGEHGAQPGSQRSREPGGEPRDEPRDEHSAAGAPEVMDGILLLRARVEEVHRLVTQRLEAEGSEAGSWLHAHAEPAWRRKTPGEVRWPVAVTTAAGIALQMAIPARLLLVSPSWIFPAAQGALLLVIVSANPHRIDRESTVLRSLSLVLAAMLSLANGYSVARLAIGITQGTMGKEPGQLLTTGVFIWLTNIVVFSLWYWEFDRGGPVARAVKPGERYPDFLFPQMTSPSEVVPPDWKPGYFDYLYVAFTNATAFSPTDVMPLSRWAKIAMLVQSAISIVTVALVVARAVNILPS